MKLEKCADTFIGGVDPVFMRKGISGGERKRLDLAAELLLTPQLIFLDEPSSGSWSLSCRACMYVCMSVVSVVRVCVCVYIGVSRWSLGMLSISPNRTDPIQKQKQKQASTR